MKLINVDELCLPSEEIISKMIISSAPTVNAIPIPESATNGDMIRAIFPNTRVYENGLDYLNLEVRIGEYPGKLVTHVSGKWWNSPYKR